MVPLVLKPGDAWYGLPETPQLTQTMNMKNNSETTNSFYFLARPLLVVLVSGAFVSAVLL